MKHRKTILLAFSVLVIWGTIGYRIYAGMQEPEMYTDAPRPRSHSAIQDSIPEYKLALNYEDPFLKKQGRQPQVSTVPRETMRRATVLPARPSVTAQESNIDWAQVEYLGSLYNKTRKSFAASVRFRGVDYSMRPGEYIENFKIEEIHRDSVKISSGPQSKYIRKK